MRTSRKTDGGKPRQLGKYELVARIAAGGMAEVYLARQLGMMNFQKVVVVKLIHPHLSTEKQFVEMFLDEARISALIKHHNVVDIYDLGLEGDTYFIAMEYIAGQALSRVISRASKGKRLDVFTTAKIIADAANGLDAAHNLTSITGDRVELVHRDVSPGNILVSYAGAVKLVDFGVSQSLSQLQTASENTQLKGKIGYASPEQLEEMPLDHRSDLFSLGVVLWEALTLNRLYRAESPGATVRKILAGSPPSPSQLRPEVPDALDAICLKALALKPEDRFQSAVEMRDALLALLREANYYGDERTVAKHMQEVFTEQRTEQESLLKRVVTAEEEIEVEIDVDEEMMDVRDPELRAAGAPIPRPATNHDEELDAELEVEDPADEREAAGATARADKDEPDKDEPDKDEPDKGEPDKDERDKDERDKGEPDKDEPDKDEPDKAKREPEPDKDEPDKAKREPDTAKREPDTDEPDKDEPNKGEPDAGEPDASRVAAETMASPISGAVELAPNEIVSLKRKRPILAFFLIAVAFVAVVVLTMEIVGSSSESKPPPPKPDPEPEPVAIPVVQPDAGIEPHMIGVPPVLERQAVGQEVALQEARILYLEGWELSRSGNGSDARIKYRAALQRVEQFSPALRGLGQSYAKDNRRSKARYYLGQYLKVAPRAADAEVMRALLAEMTD